MGINQALASASVAACASTLLSPPEPDVSSAIVTLAQIIFLIQDGLNSLLQNEPKLLRHQSRGRNSPKVLLF
jgi:hypothetical protein